MASAFCLVRHGTSLDHLLASNVFRRFPLLDKILEVDLDQWDGQAPLPHSFYDQMQDMQRISPQLHAFNKGYPSVTALISCIGPKEALYNWQENQIKLLGMAGFRSHGLKRMNNSSKLHSLIQSSLKNFCLEEKVKPKDQILEENANNGGPIPEGFLHSILPILQDLLKDVREADRARICYEQMVYNHRLIYRGKFDAILPIGGELTLVDWKGCSVGSSKAQQTPENAALSQDNKMQLAAYVAAVNSDPDFGHLSRIKQAAIVKIFESGRQAELVPMDEEEIEQTYELFKGWSNAFWSKMETAKTQIVDGREMIDFCYSPRPTKKGPVGKKGNARTSI